MLDPKGHVISRRCVQSILLDRRGAKWPWGSKPDPSFWAGFAVAGKKKWASEGVEGPRPDQWPQPEEVVAISSRLSGKE
jgi:hypothetical protein